MFGVVTFVFPGNHYVW